MSDTDELIELHRLAWKVMLRQLRKTFSEQPGDVALMLRDKDFKCELQVLPLAGLAIAGFEVPGLRPGMRFNVELPAVDPEINESGEAAKNRWKYRGANA